MTSATVLVANNKDTVNRCFTYLTCNTTPCPIHDGYLPDIDFLPEKSVDIVRIEFKTNEVRQGGKLPGRVFMQLTAPARLDEIIVDLNYTIVGLKGDGTVVPLAGYRSANAKILPIPLDNKNKPQAAQAQQSNFVVMPTQDTSRRVTLPQGMHAIPFEIQVPKGMTPTFNYVSPKNGVSVTNNYSAEAAVKFNGKTVRTNRVTIIVKSLGNEQGGLGYSDGNVEMAITKKYVKKDGDFAYAIGQTHENENPKWDVPTPVIVQKVDCPPLGINDERILRPNLNPKSSGKSASVIDDYNNEPTNAPKLHNKDFKVSYDEKKAEVRADLPSIEVDGTTYEAPFAVVDEVEPGWQPTHLTQPAGIRRV
ncbi:unnamed protein product [Dibothriocephalus latus]|uniref:Arrestin-like N-terminal domain-containing protein n=1 Tax=Dibothriocephalus latus TaxID=60516 RepID=A0A3P7NIX1_DIBLA|nr:unnamed protein product [Dibothriocephalus latus]